MQSKNTTQTLFGTRANNRTFGYTSLLWATPMAIIFRTFGPI